MAKFAVSLFHLLPILLLSACANFDKTDIASGERVFGPGFSFEPPGHGNWFTVEYGTSHRLKISQINYDDSFSILVSLNHGPRQGMYPSADAHLNAVRAYKRQTPLILGFKLHKHTELIDSRYGELCVRYTDFGEDWAGRNRAGPALVDKVGLICPHPLLENVLVSTEIRRRYETHAPKVNLGDYADRLFSSFEYSLPSEEKRF